MEGIGNPALNMSSPDLSAYQTSEKKVIRQDLLNHTLAAHQCRLPASAELRGVTSVLIIFTLWTSIASDICYAPDLTWASWSQHQAFHSEVSAQASLEALNVMWPDTLRSWCAGHHLTYEGC